MLKIPFQNRIPQVPKSIRFEDTNTIVHILRDDDGSILVDLDEIALVLRKRGRKWMNDSDYTDVERKNMFGLLDQIVGETVSTIKQHASE